MRRTTKAIVSIAGSCALAFLTPAPAQALDLRAYILVNTYDLSATAEVYDDVFGGVYTGTLSATGEVSCTGSGPHTVMHSVAFGSGNPMRMWVPGSCQFPYAGWVTYTLGWVGVVGTSGAHAVHCVIAFGGVVCTPAGAQ